MCRPSVNTENSRRTQEKPLVPRVFFVEKRNKNQKWYLSTIIKLQNRLSPYTVPEKEELMWSVKFITCYAKDFKLLMATRPKKVTFQLIYIF